MEKEIKITTAGPEHLESLTAIFSEGFYPKFAYVSDDPDKQRSFVRDFGLINLKAEDKEFAALEGDRVMGYLSLRFKGQKGLMPSPLLSFPGMLRRYGLKGIIKAYRLGMTFNYNPPKGELYIDTVAVSSDARGQGIGSRLLDFCENFAREKGFNRLSLMVMRENPRAKALYERVGFKIESTKDLSWYEESSGYSGAYYMVRKL